MSDDARSNSWPRGRSGPSGIPIGRAFVIAPGVANDELRNAVATIGRVHGDGALPTIPLMFTGAIAARGRLIVRNGVPSAILIDGTSRHLAITVFHEIGHVLDLAGAGEGIACASPSLSVSDDWLLSVLESRTFQRLNATIELTLANIPMDQAQRRQRIVTLRVAEELWARTYAQYVVLRSQQTDLAAQFSELRVAADGEFEMPLQWDDDEFVGIADRIDNMMRRFGWRSE